MARSNKLTLGEREVQLGRVFNTEPGLLLKIPKNFSDLKEIALRHYEAGGKVRANGEIEPLRNDDLINEVKTLLRGYNGITWVQRYPIVRLKPTRNSGRYDSSWIHSDMWSGNPPGAIIMIPITGDIENGGVEFYRPTKNIDLMDMEYPTYQDVPDFGPEYIGKMEPGFMHVVDAYCLHRTMPGMDRISVDFRIHFGGMDRLSKRAGIDFYWPYANY